MRTDVCFWHKADMNGSGLLPRKMRLAPISLVTNP